MQKTYLHDETASNRLNIKSSHWTWLRNAWRKASSSVVKVLTSGFIPMMTNQKYPGLSMGMIISLE